MAAIGAAGGGTHSLRPFVAQQLVFTTLFVLLVAGAWAGLWLWSASPYARYLQHPGWADVTTFASFCRDVATPVGVHVLSWMLMIAAMMLPTTYPLLAMFRRITAGRTDAARLLLLVVAGFLAAWIAFGLVAHLADAGLRAALASSDWVVTHGWAIGAAVLASAGVFQFSKLKYRCLEQCQSPFSFVASRWHGAAPAGESVRLGFDHGVFCVGCCWALMLLMFVVGTGNLGWMLALSAVMAAEKNLPWGRRLRTPLGLGLLGWAGTLALLNL
jgi:predicted metal-binding membrane protein